ncbi:AAA family ATPase [Arthrobacter sp. I2-34]|uniref:AAA family ATPase n=1 Tax=Arthrobacter hankyongi TaxID=2904801 RepID=A0ABS9L600_9MICC|nr:LuxR family transcriptional regulator [Arthrobacter hankyongi]MCG2621914.1 AAA family ATPase [Arthrobacter hankyongi]
MVHGRQDERAAIAALVDEAWASRGGALVVRGLPGVGKSTLLDDAVARSEGMQVLRTAGIESESPLAFAALHRLLRPLMPRAGSLPEPQARALRAAFGEIASDGVDRFLIFLAALSLLADAAEDGPVLAVVDDAQWLDEVSAAALLFVARRLDAERVALLFAARDGDERRFDSADLPGIVLSGLDEAAAAAVLAECSGVEVPAEVAGELVRGTGGNPLALVELAGSLSVDQLAGTSRLPARLPLTAGVERAFLDRYRSLPESARTWLLVAAADDAGAAAVVRAAARALGAGGDGLEVAEQSGLLSVQDGQLKLRHPLVRSAVYGAAPGQLRRQVHRALADALAGEHNRDRRVWHLSAAAEEPDPAVAAELDQVADRARRRGGHEAAVAAWERAAGLSTDAAAKAAFLHAAAGSAWLAGQPVRARALNDVALDAATDPGLRADAALLRARIEWNTGSLQQGHHLVLEGAREVAPADPVRARQMAMFAAALASFGGGADGGVSPVSLATEPEDGAPARQRCCWNLLVGFHHVRCGELEEGAAVLRAAYADGASLEDADQDLLPNLGVAAMLLGDDREYLQYHRLLLARARSTGAYVLALYALTRRGLADFVTGSWGNARAAATEALQLARGTGQAGLAAYPLAMLALLDAVQQDEGFAGHLAEAEDVAGGRQLGTLGGMAHDVLLWAKALRSGQADTAFHHLAQLQLPGMQYLTAIDRVEAAVRSGRPEQAAAWLDDLRRYAAATGNAWPAAAVAHGQALLAEGAGAEALYLAALERHRSSLRVFDRARTQLAYGEFLRRARRRVDARVHLQAALDTFTDLGARAWAERAGQELRASGRTARKRDPSTTAALTPQELQVAGLVQQGLSNREAAAQLFLSPRTIDFHLRNVFAKLGISTRAELIRRRLEGNASGGA